MKILGDGNAQALLKKYPKAQKPFNDWYYIVDLADWNSFPNVKDTFGKRADYVSSLKQWVFDFGGTKFRVICTVSFNAKLVIIEHCFDHKQYEDYLQKNR